MRYLPHWTVRNIIAAVPPKLLKLCRRAAWRELTEGARLCQICGSGGRAGREAVVISQHHGRDGRSLAQRLLVLWGADT